MRGFISGLVIGLVIGAVLAVTAPSSNAPLQYDGPTTKGAKKKWETNIRWKMASAFPGDMPVAGNLARTFADRLKITSNGEVDIEFHEPGALVPTLDLLDAVASGAVESGFASPIMWGNKSPALELFGAVPFGPDTKEFLAWWHTGGGKKFYNNLYHQMNVHGILCGTTGIAGGGWFARQISQATDLKGMKVAASGLAATIYRTIGAKPIRLAPADISAKAQKNELDGVSFSMPSIDRYLDLDNFAKYYYFPGWHQQSGFYDLIINLGKWNDLSQRQRIMIEMACAANIQEGIALGEGTQFKALKDIVIRGVEVKKWPSGVTEAMRQAWAKVVREKSAADKNFRRVFSSLKKFREDYSIWRELGELKP